MPNAANRPPDSRFMGLFVSPTKSGKTVAACSFPGPIKVFDFDGRIGGLDGAPWIDKSQVDYTYYPPRVGPQEVPTYVKINKDMELLLAECRNGQNRYKTIVLDSITSQTYALLCDSISLTKGKMIGQQKMAGPEDYGFEAQGTYDIMSFLRSLPIPNIIVSAHVIDRYGKLNPADKYSESVVVGEKLSIRDKIGENIGIYFDHMFRFNRQYPNFTVEFRSTRANTSYAALPDGQIDITDKPFYPLMQQYLRGEIK